MGVGDSRISIPVSLRLQIENLKDIKSQVQMNMKDLKVDSKSYRDLAKQLSTIDRLMTQLELSSSKGFASQSDFNKTEKVFDSIEQTMLRIQQIESSINFKDLNLTGEQLDHFKQLQQNVEDAKNSLETFKQTAKQSLLGNEVTKKVIDDLGGTLSTQSLQTILNRIISAYNSAVAQVNEKRAELTEAMTGQGVQKAYIEGFEKTGFSLTEQLKANFNAKDAKRTNFDSKSFSQALLQQMGLPTKDDFAKELQAKIEELSGPQIIKQLKDSSSELGKMILSQLNNKLTADTQENNNLNAEITELQAKADSLKPAFDRANTIVGQLATKQKDAAAVTKEASDALKQEQDAAVKSTQAQHNFGAAVEKTNATLQTGLGELRQYNEELVKQDRRMQTMNSMKMAITNFFGFQQVLNLIKTGVRNAINHIKELDKVITDIAIVTDMSAGDLWGQIDQYSKLAQTYGVSIKGAYEVSKIWYQQGLETNEVMNLTNETLKLAKISGLDYANATDYLTTAIRGFKLEMSEASTVVDVYSNLAANTAVSTEELAVAMSKTASSMESVGSTFQESSAMIATMVAVTRESATNIGSALKSIAARYGEMKKDPTQLVDSEGEAMSFNKVDAALQSVGITLKTVDGQFRSFTDVILELSSVWDQLDSTQQRYIATQFAGNRQQSRFLALVSNQALLQRNITNAEDAEGTGTEQALTALDSLEAKLEQVKVAYQQFYTSIGLESLGKGLLDAIRSIIDSLNSLPKAFGKIPGAAIVVISNIISLLKNVLLKGFVNVANQVNEALKKGKDGASDAGTLTMKSYADKIREGGQEAIKEAENIREQVVDKLSGKDATFEANQEQKEQVKAEQKSALVNPYTSEVQGAVQGIRETKEALGKVDVDSNAYKELQEDLKFYDEYLLEAQKNEQQWAQEHNLAVESAGEGTEKLSARFKNWYENSAKGVVASQKFGSAMRSLGTALTTVSLMFDSSSRGGKTAAGVFQIVAGAAYTAAAAQQALNASNPFGWISMAVSAVTMVISGISSVIETQEERIERLNKEAEELKTTASQVKSDLKILNSGIDKVNELKEKRYESAEAAAEYQEEVDKLAETFPELISGFDAAGNVIIDATNAEEILAEARRKSAQATYDAAAKEFETAQAEEKDAQDKLKSAQVGAGTSELWTSRLSADDLWGSNTNAQLSKLILEGVVKLDESEKIGLEGDTYGTIETQLKTKKVRKAYSDYLLGLETDYDDYFKNMTIGGSGSTIEEVKKSLEESNLYTQDILDFFQLVGEARTSGDVQKITQAAEKYRSLMESGTLGEDQEEYLSQIYTVYWGTDGLFANINEKNEEYLAAGKVTNARMKAMVAAGLNTDLLSKEYMEQSTGLLNVVTNAITSQYSNYLEEAGDDAQDFSDWIIHQDFYKNTNDAIQKWYNSLTDSQQALIDEIDKNKGQYSADTLIAELGLDKNDELYDYIVQYYGETANDVKNRIKENIKKSGNYNYELSGIEEFYGGMTEIFIRSTGILTSDFEKLTTQAVKLLSSYSGRGMGKQSNRLGESIEGLYTTLSNYYENNEKEINEIVSYLYSHNALGSKEEMAAAIDELEKVYGDQIWWKDIRIQLETVGTHIYAAMSAQIDKIDQEVRTFSKDISGDVAKAIKGVGILDATTLYQQMDSAVEGGIGKFEDIFTQDASDTTKWVIKNGELLTKYINAKRAAYQKEYDELSGNLDELTTWWNSLELDGKGSFSLEGELPEGQTLYSYLEEQVQGTDYEDVWNQMAQISEGALHAYADYLTGVLDEDEFIDKINEELAANRSNLDITQIIAEDTNEQLIRTYNLAHGLYIEEINRLLTHDVTQISDILTDGIVDINKLGEDADKASELQATVDAVQSGIADFVSDVIESPQKALANIANYENLGINSNDFEGFITAIQTNDRKMSLAFVNKWRDEGLLIDSQYNTIIQSIEDSTRNRAAQDALKNVTFVSEKIGRATMDTMVAVANALNKSVDKVFGRYQYRADTGDYIFTISEELTSIENYEQLYTESVISYFESINSLLEKAIKGAATAADQLNLIEMLSAVGVDVSNIENQFTQTADGFKLASTAAREVYVQLKGINELAARTTLSALVASAKAADSSLSNIYVVIQRIDDLNSEIAKAEYGSTRRVQLEAELDIAKQIKAELESAGNAFNFMNNKLPTAYTNPLSAWEGMGDAFKILDGADYKKGYIGFQDFFNMVTAAGDEALQAAGVFKGDIQTAAGLIQAAGGALKNIDGKTVVDLSKLGADFNLGADKMKDGLDKGIKTVAQSQIEMLDAMIQMLEVVVAMEELGNVDIDSDGFINLDELFNNDGTGTDEWAKASKQIATSLVAAGLEIENIYIAGVKLSDILSASKDDLKKLGLSEKEFVNIINSLYQLALNPDFNPDDLPGLLSQLGEGIGEAVTSFNENGLSYKITPEGKLFTVDLGDENSISDALKDAGMDTAVKDAKAAVEKYLEGDKDLTDNEKITAQLLLGEIDIDYNAKDGTTIYTSSYGKQHKCTTSKNNLSARAAEIAKFEHDDALIAAAGVKDSYEGFNDTSHIMQIPIRDGLSVEVVETIEADDSGFKCILTKNGHEYIGTGDTLEEARAKAQQAFLASDDVAGAIKDKKIADIVQKEGYHNENKGEIPLDNGESLTLVDTTTLSGTKYKIVTPDEGIKEFDTEEARNEWIANYKANLALQDDDSGEGETTEIPGGTVILNPATVQINIATGENGTTEVQLVESIEATANEVIISPAEGVVPKLKMDETSVINIGEVGPTEGTTSQVTLTPTKAILATDENNIVAVEDVNVVAKALGVTVQEKDETVVPEWVGNTLTFDAENAFGNATKVTITKTGEEKDSFIGVVSLDTVTGDVTTAILNADGIKVQKLENGEAVSFSGVNINGTDVTVTLTEDSVTFTTPDGNDLSIGDVDVNTVLAEGGVLVSGENGITLGPELAAALASENNTLNIYVNDSAETKAQTIIDAIVADCKAAHPEIKVKVIEDPDNPPLLYNQDDNYGLSDDANEANEEVNDRVVKAIEKGGDNTGVTNTAKELIGEADELFAKAIEISEKYTAGETLSQEDIDFLLTYKDTLETLGVDFENLDAAADTVLGTNGILTQLATQLEDGISKAEILLELLAQIKPLESPSAEPVPTPSAPTPSKKKEKPIKITSDNGLKKADKVSGSEFTEANAALQTLKATILELATAISTIPDNANYVSSLATAMTNIPSGIAGKITALAAAMNKIPNKKTLTGIINFKFNGASNSPLITPPIKLYKSGNVALKSGRQRTLMGELGPELVVSKGRYFVVGQNGAEMVDLDPDAVVFNHLQTKKLLTNGKSGRGKAITNEHAAVSMATGNVGPAMASASSALSALKQLREMWQALLNASLSDLGKLAGAGGGGGGGGGGKNKDNLNSGYIAEIELWYNVLRQIAGLEKDINYEEALRKKLSSDLVANGEAYYQSQKRSLEALNQTAAKQAQLAALQKSYYERRTEDLKDSAFSQIFTYDANGQIQYNDKYRFANGDKGGLAALAKLNATNANGSAVLSDEEKYKLLQKWGFGGEMLYDSEGNKIVKDKDNPDEFYTKSVQAFWDKLDGWKDELDGYYDGYREAEQEAIEAQQQANEILQEMRNNQITLEGKVLKAIEDRRQAEIDELQDIVDAFQEASDKYIDGLNKQLQREQQMYQNNKAQEDIDKNRRRLAIMQRSGASASEIASLQNTIDDRAQQMYFDKQQQQIDAIQEASDAQLEKMNEQIDLMKEQLDYEKTNGLLWADVYDIMKLPKDQIEQFITAYNADYKGLSQAQLATELQSLEEVIGQWVGRRDDEKGDPVEQQPEKSWEEIRKGFEQKGYTNVNEATWEQARKKYEEEINAGRTSTEALEEVEKILKGKKTDNGKAAQEAWTKYNEDKEAQKKLTDTYGSTVVARYKSQASEDYQSKYQELLNKGKTAKEAEAAARQAAEEAYKRGFNETKTESDKFWTEKISKGKNRLELVKGSINNLDTQIWKDNKAAIKEAYKKAYIETGSDVEARKAAKKVYTDAKKEAAAQEAWKNWKNNASGDYKKFFNSSNPIATEEGPKAREVFKKAYKAASGNAKEKTNAAITAVKDYLKPIIKRIKNGTGFREGGIVDYTGIAQVHGTPTKPEAFLSAADTQMWKHDILGAQSGSLTSSLLDLNELVQNMVTGNKIEREDSKGFSIGNIDFTMNATIANDYDAKKAGRLAFEEMLKIAQKTGPTSLARR